ncbi:hypothetical protein [Pseudomonas sp. DE0010]|uniref:hypothetical protein n=1 Tax=Pseudomonas sp. DE0010 TaxID=2584951 RepID=UPI0011A0314C|nr:hypothetical protein [Pseudomonas sp. DE0010]
MPLPRTTRIAAAIVVLPLAHTTQAATWQSTVVVPTSVEHDSNPLLLSSGEKGVTRTLIAPDYTLIGSFGPDELRLGLGLDILRSSDTNVVDDREDPDISLGWQRTTERGQFGLLARYNETSTLSGTVLDTGVVTTDGTQKLYTLTGNWRQAITERSTLSNETTYNRARYDINSLTGYDELANTLTWTYAWSERADVYTRFGARRYEPDDDLTATSSNSYSPAVGIKYQFSESLSADAHLGVNKVSGSKGGRRGEGGVALLYTGARSDASLTVERSTVASAQGGFAQLDQVRGVWSYALDPLTRVGADAAWQDSKGQIPNTLQIYSLWASRQLSPYWDVRLALTYKERKQDLDGDATATIVGLTLTYRYPDI